MNNTLVFDIETIPDVSGLRLIHNLDLNLSDSEVATLAMQKQKELKGSEFLPVWQHRVIAISCILRDEESIRLRSLAEPEHSEKEIIQSFFTVIDKYIPRLISWNGGGFDLSVLIYRGLLNQVTARKFWDTGENDKSSDFKWNNYINRYHTRHLDLMDILSFYQPKNSVSLNELSRLMSLPGKFSLEGASVWEFFQAGKLQEIVEYCEIDVFNTYLLYLGFERMRENLTEEEYGEEISVLRKYLKSLNKPHLNKFLALWSGR